MKASNMRKEASTGLLEDRCHAEELLDASLADTFPASDPVSLIAPICSTGRPVIPAPCEGQRGQL